MMAVRIHCSATMMQHADDDYGCQPPPRRLTRDAAGAHDARLDRREHRIDHAATEARDGGEGIQLARAHGPVEHRDHEKDAASHEQRDAQHVDGGVEYRHEGVHAR